MKNNTFRSIGFLIGILTTCLIGSAVQADNNKIFSGNLSLGAGSAVSINLPHFDNNSAFIPDWGHHPTSMIASLHLQAAPQGCKGIMLCLDIVHPFFNDNWGYWAGQRHLGAEASLPVNFLPRTRAFVSYQRNYGNKTDGFCWTGLRVGF